MCLLAKLFERSLDARLTRDLVGRSIHDLSISTNIANIIIIRSFLNPLIQTLRI